MRIICSREIFTKKCRQQQSFNSVPKEAWHFNHVTFTSIAKNFMLYCRLIYMLSILYVRLTIKLKVRIPESFKVGWYPYGKTGSSHLNRFHWHYSLSLRQILRQDWWTLSFSFLVLPLTVEPSKPRLCHDERFLNLWIWDLPFKLDHLQDRPRCVLPGNFQTTFEGWIPTPQDSSELPGIL